MLSRARTNTAGTGGTISPSTIGRTFLFVLLSSTASSCIAITQRRAPLGIGYPRRYTSGSKEISMWELVFHRSSVNCGLGASKQGALSYLEVPTRSVGTRVPPQAARPEAIASHLTSE